MLLCLCAMKLPGSSPWVHCIVRYWSEVFGWALFYLVVKRFLPFSISSIRGKCDVIISQMLRLPVALLLGAVKQAPEGSRVPKELWNLLVVWVGEQQSSLPVDVTLVFCPPTPPLGQICSSCCSVLALLKPVTVTAVHFLAAVLLPLRKRSLANYI